MKHLVTIPVAAEPATAARFDGVSIGLHWATVILIVAMFASAWSIGLASDAATAAGRLTVHRSVGVTLWLLAIARLSWRVRFAVRPPLPASLPALQHLAAAVTEGALYVLLLTQPLTGLAQSLTRGKPFQLFAFQAPALMARDKPLTGLFHQIHELTAWVLLGLIAVHVGAALFHRLVLKDRVLQSMWPEFVGCGRAPRA
jgi:cytochrome b561